MAKIQGVSGHLQRLITAVSKSRRGGAKPDPVAQHIGGRVPATVLLHGEGVPCMTTAGSRRGRG